MPIAVEKGRIEEGVLSEPLIADGQRLHVQVRPTGSGKLHMRRAVKGALSENSKQVDWLVAGLNGVNVYLHEDDTTGKVTAVITTEDLKP
jgi:hypothetical protein